MKQLRSTGAIVLAAVLAQLSANTPAVADTPQAKAATAEKFALMIGIDKYPVCALEGCRNDIEEMKKTLISKYQFSDDHIKTLFDAEATKDNIINAFRTQLIDNAIKNPNAIFLFEYSGHGDYAPDDDGDETDGVDETIVPYDAIKDANNDIRDDKLNDLFKELSRHTDNITFIIDACHSGSITRDAKQAKVRTVDTNTHKDRIAKLQPTSRTAVRYRGPSAQHALPEIKRYVALSGCDSDETSAETSSNNKPYGLMTSSLLTALKSSDKPRTYKDIWHQYSTLVSAANNRQHPQIEGDSDRLLFGTASDRLESGIEVRVENNKVTLDAGESGGIKTGALIAIYDKEATKLSGDAHLLAQGVVSEAGATKSTIKLSDASVPLDKFQEAKAIVLSPPVVQPISIGFQTSGKIGNDWIQALKSRLGNAKCFELGTVSGNPLTPSGRKDQISIVPMQYKEYEKLKDQRIKALFTDRGPSKQGFVLLTKSGDVLFDKFVEIPETTDSAAQEQVAKQLESMLYRQMRQSAVQALENEKSKIKDCLKVTAYKVKTDSQDKVLSREELVTSNFRTPKVLEGETIQFEIENVGPSTVYPTIVDLGTGGGVQVVYPPRDGATALKPGGKFLSPVMQAGAPYGIESFKFFATTQKADFDFLNTEGAVREVVRATGRGESKLRDVFIKAATGDTTSAPNMPTPDEWATTVSKLSIVPQPDSNTQNQ